MKQYILILSIIYFFNSCREYSCENCRELPTLPPDTIRTTPNQLIVRCSVYISDESKVRKIYLETTTKYQPQTYRIFDSLMMDGRKLYDTSFRIENYFDMNKFAIGDTFNYRTEVRNKFSADFFNDSTLIY